MKQADPFANFCAGCGAPLDNSNSLHKASRDGHLPVNKKKTAADDVKLPVGPGGRQLSYRGSIEKEIRRRKPRARRKYFFAEGREQVEDRSGPLQRRRRLSQRPSFAELPRGHGRARRNLSRRRRRRFSRRLTSTDIPWTCTALRGRPRSACRGRRRRTIACTPRRSAPTCTWTGGARRARKSGSTGYSTRRSDGAPCAAYSVSRSASATENGTPRSPSAGPARWRRGTPSPGRSSRAPSTSCDPPPRTAISPERWTTTTTRRIIFTQIFTAPDPSAGARFERGTPSTTYPPRAGRSPGQLRQGEAGVEHLDRLQAGFPREYVQVGDEFACESAVEQVLGGYAGYVEEGSG